MLIKQWNLGKGGGKGGGKGTPFPPRLADVLADVISTVLYDPVAFKLRDDRFCLLGRGNDAFSVRYSLPALALTAEERALLVGAFARRKVLFSSVKMVENNVFSCEQFGFDGGSASVNNGGGVAVFDPMWKREIVRDFVWILLKPTGAAVAGATAVIPELIAAMQTLMLEHKQGRQDVFLSALHSGVQGMTQVRLVPCWGLDARDLHTEEALGTLTNKK